MSTNNAVRRAPKSDRGNNLVAEKSLLASAGYEQLNSMESSRLVYLYNLDPPGDPWCRTMNLWRQHCLQWVEDLLLIIIALNNPGTAESFIVSSITDMCTCFFCCPFSTIIQSKIKEWEVMQTFRFSIWQVTVTVHLSCSVPSVWIRILRWRVSAGTSISLIHFMSWSQLTEFVGQLLCFAWMVKEEIITEDIPSW